MQSCEFEGSAAAADDDVVSAQMEYAYCVHANTSLTPSATLEPGLTAADRASLTHTTQFCALY